MVDPQGLQRSADTPAPSRRWSFGAAVLDEATLELHLAGAPVHLERKPLEALLHLLRHAGEVVTKEELQEAVWPGRFLSESVLTNCLSRIRDAIGDDHQVLIKTVHGYGYRLAAPVTTETRGAPQAPALQFRVGTAPPQRPLWRFERCLGRGGQGEVWLARHEKTKEPRVFKYALGSGITTLKREVTLYRVLRQALPEHSDYVTLLDWNLEEPPCFVEAEYTAGGSLPDWADARGGLRGLPIGTRLEVLAQTAEALAHAHAVGVLHKDLKPPNVLVVAPDGLLRVKLADFGSGALLDAAALGRFGITQLGFTRGTGPEGETGGTAVYLAPEVLAGQPPTVQSDIYALGVMLYQLVAGDFRRPLAPGWEKDVADELLREDIAAAAAGNPGDRLRDAADLAQRLRTLETRRADRQRHRRQEERIERERVAARQVQEALERARSRRAWMLATIVALVVGLTATAVQFLEARRASREAEAVSSFVLHDMLDMASPYGGPVRDLTFRHVLDRAAAVVDERFAAEPAVAARIHLQLGQAYSWLRQPEEARSHFERAATGFAALLGHSAPPALLAREGVARSMLEGEDPGESLVALEDIEAQLERDLPRLHPRRLQAGMQAAVAAFAGDPERAAAKLRLLAAESRRADWTLLTPAEQAFYFRHYGDLIRGDELAEEVRLNLGTLLGKAGRRAEAESILRPVLAYYEARYGESHYATSLARLNLATVLIRLGHGDEAEPHFLRAVHDLRSWLGRDHADTMQAELAAATLRLEQGRIDDALSLYDGVARRCVSAECPARLAHAAAHMTGVLHVQQGNLDAGSDALRRAVERAGQTFGAGAPETVYSRGLLASLLHARGDFAGARSMYDRLLEDCRAGGGPVASCARWTEAIARLDRDASSSR